MAGEGKTRSVNKQAAGEYYLSGRCLQVWTGGGSVVRNRVGGRCTSIVHLAHDFYSR